jgi:hypothetical protein
MHVADLLDGWAGFLHAPASGDALASVDGYASTSLGLPFLV